MKVRGWPVEVRDRQGAGSWLAEGRLCGSLWSQSGHGDMLNVIPFTKCRGGRWPQSFWHIVANFMCSVVSPHPNVKHLLSFRVSLQEFDDALITDPEKAANQMKSMLNGNIVAVDGTELQVKIQSVCVHSDTPNAVDIATAVKNQLDQSIPT